MGDDGWDQPRQGDLGAARQSPQARRTPPGPADPTELMPGAGHFDGVTFAEEADQATDVIVPRPRPAGSRPGRRGPGRRIAAITGYTVLGLVSLLVLGITGYAWGTYDTFDTGVHKSDALISPT